MQGQNFLLQSFSNIAKLQGGFNTDQFFLQNAAVSPGGSVDGGPGVNWLFGGISGTTNTWIVSGINSGTFVAGQQNFPFTNIHNLNGSDAVDIFTLRGGVLFGSGAIDGGDGEDTIVQEDPVATTWTLTGDDAGTLSDATPETFTVNGVMVTTSVILKDGFTNIENLIGSPAADTFVVNDGVVFPGDVDAGGGADSINFIGTGHITGTINGGSDGTGSTDTIDFSAATGPVTIHLGDPAFAGVERIIGNGANTTVIGPDAASTWTLTGLNAGTVNSTAFANVANLRGGAAVDAFVFQPAGRLSGRLDGGAGADTLDESAFTTARLVTLTGLGDVDGFVGTEAAVTGGFANMDALMGGTAVDTLAGLNAAATWTVAGAAVYVSTNTLSFSRFETLVGGTNADTFTVAASSTVESRFDDTAAGLDGWTTLNDATNLTYVASGGNPGGFAQATDRGLGTVWYWVAPAKFRGNQTAKYGGTLSFDLRQSPATNQFAFADDVVLSGGGLSLFATLGRALGRASPGTLSTCSDRPGVSGVPADRLLRQRRCFRYWVT